MKNGIIIKEISIIALGDLRMNKISGADLIEKTYQLYLAEKFQEGFDFLVAKLEDLDEINATIYNLHSSLAFRLGNHELGYNLLKEAVLEKEYWYPTAYMKQNEDYLRYQGDPTFQEILLLCQKREELHRYSGRPQLIINEPANFDHPQLVLALHGNNQPLSGVQQHWNHETCPNVVIAIPISSEISFANGHVWNDIPHGIAEVQTHYEMLVSKYNLQPKDITLAGFSAGASIILQGLIEGKLLADRIILVAPWLPNFLELQVKLEILKTKKTKIYIVCGSQDQPCLPWANQLTAELKMNHIPFHYKLIEGLTHRYPDNFGTILADIKGFFER